MSASRNLSQCRWPNNSRGHRAGRSRVRNFGRERTTQSGRVVRLKDKEISRTGQQSRHHKRRDLAAIDERRIHAGRYPVRKLVTGDVRFRIGIPCRRRRDSGSAG